ncbi:MAG: carboxypeptidase-like regulatory domain-containing protein, partial [Flavobacteriaceae bacterium]
MSNGILTLLLALVAQVTFAQIKTVSGTVTDSGNVPLPGVNIIVEGTSNGTLSDFDGNFTISASVGDVLILTYIGQKDVRLTIGSSDFYSVQMEEDAQQLDEVVVTSLGLKREARSLGYSVAKVTGEDVQGRAEPDLLRAMQGKMTGVNITGGGGAPGQGTKINIRGMSSLTGNTQPLFIV